MRLWWDIGVSEVTLELASWEPCSCNVPGRTLCTLRTGITLEQVSFLYDGERLRCALLLR